MIDDDDYTMETAKTRAIERALAKTAGHVLKAADLLDISKNTVYAFLNAKRQRKRGQAVRLHSRAVPDAG